MAFLILFKNDYFSHTSTLPDGETVVNRIADLYETFSHESLVINVLAGILVALAILIPCILRCDAFRKGIPREGRSGDDFESHNGI